MSIEKRWLRQQAFARSIPRAIDRETLIDLLGIVIYEADRSALLEEAGYSDDTPAVECLFDFVLDALGVPPTTASFSRTPFEELFYNDYWLEKKYDSLSEVLDALEALRGDVSERASQAETNRAVIRIVKPNSPQ